MFPWVTLNIKDLNHAAARLPATAQGLRAKLPFLTCSGTDRPLSAEPLNEYHFRPYYRENPSGKQPSLFDTQV